MTRSNFVHELREIRELLSGNYMLDVAQARINRLAEQRMAREQVLGFADLCRVADLPALGVRAFRKYLANLSPDEATTLATCQLRLSMSRAAMSTLTRFGGMASPEGKMAAASCALHRLDYALALRILSELLEDKRPDEVLRLTGEVLLGYCRVALEPDFDFESFFRPLLDRSVAMGHLQMGELVHYVVCQGYLRRGDVPKMGAYLKASAKPAVLARSTYLLPWQWLSLPAFKLSADEVATRLREDQLWGTLRLFRLLERQRAADAAGLAELYWRSPLEGFRRLLRDVAGEPPPLQFVGGRGDGPWIDMVSGLHSGDTGYLKPGSVTQRLFAFLAADGFQAFGVPEIFEGVFKGEAYDPDKSREKTLKAIRALERWLVETGAPVLIHEEQIGGADVFELRARNQGVRWRMSHISAEDPQGEGFRRSLEGYFARGPFAASDAADRLGVSVRTINRRLRALEAEGWVESMGQGRARKHRLR